MPKFYRRRFARGPRDKYSVEQSSFINTTNASGDLAIQLIPTLGVGGMRKVKHLTVSLTTQENQIALYWALVYVPQGTSPSPLSVATAASSALYEPNQFVMNAGIIDPSAGPIRISTPVSRNLNSGDTIYLIMKAIDQAAGTVIAGVVRYAITLQ